MNTHPQRKVFPGRRPVRSGREGNNPNQPFTSRPKVVWSRMRWSTMLAVALVGFWFCDNASANIALQDGSTAVTTSASTSVSVNNFTVTPGASVLIVTLVDRNNSSANGGPASLTWNGGTAQVITRVVSVNGANSTWAWADIYYLFNPTPGTATITATDTSGNTPSAMTIQAFTLSGVDPAVSPVPYTANNASANSVSVNLGSGTPAFGWAAVCASYGTTTGNGFQLSANGGVLSYTRSTVAIQEAQGYLANLMPGSSTVTATDTSGGTQKLALGAAVFAPYLPGPAAPTGFTATAQQNQVALSWADGSSGAATSYIIWRAAGASFSAIATNSGNANVNYTDTAVTDWTTYNYLIQAIGGSGLGGFSSLAAATPVGAPFAPTGLAVAGNGTQAVMTWNAPVGTTSYNVLRSTTSGSGYTQIASGVGSPTYTDTMSLGSTYYYVVQAVNTYGTSGNSSQVSITALSAPNSLVATGSTNRVDLSWADTSGGGATSYLVSRSVTSGSGYLPLATLNGNGSTSFTDRTVFDGMTYYYIVQGLTTNDTSTASSQSSAAPFFALPAGVATGIVKPDGGTNSITTVANGAGSIISNAFTVSQGSHALVVELWDKNTLNDGSSPQFMTWVVGNTTNILTRAVSRSSATATYSDCNIYYAYNPVAGTGYISGTDTNGDSLVQGMTMMAFTLRGVDTTVAPLTYSAANASATTLSITTSAMTPSNAWAAVMSYDGNSGQAITQTSTTGSSISRNVNNGEQQCLGYVSGLRAGSSTIGMTAAGGANKCTLAVVLFMPAVPTPIAILDGTIFPVTHAGNGVPTISKPFSVSQGATALAVALMAFNNNNPYPTNVVWTNATLGTTQIVGPGSVVWAGYGQSHPNVYYLMDPLPGTGYLMATDPNGTAVQDLTMQAYTLVGVDTSLPVAGYGLGTQNPSPASTTSFTVNLSSGTLVNSWATLNSDNYNGGTGNHITYTASSGTVVFTNVWPNNAGFQCAMGYVSNLGAGASSITATGTGGATGMGINAEVFSPLVLVPAVSAPTNVVATGQTNQVLLTWNDSSGGLANNFIVLRSITSGSGYVQLAILSGNTTNYLDTAVYDGTPYYYVVEAVNNAGTSPPSTEAGATPVFALPAGFSGNISKLDGGTANDITMVANGAGSSISANFSVSAGASVLVVELWDKNSFNNNSSPLFLTWTTGAGSQILLRAISQVSGAATYSDCDIYYCFNPAPGTGTIDGTDTNFVTIQGMTMLPFTLKGVDTTVAPLTYGINSASTTSLQVVTSVRTPPGAWAAVMSYDANGGANITQSSTSGTSTYQNVNNNDQQALGYVSGLAGGSSTISMTHAGTANSALAVAVFMPSIGTGIALHDGSIFSTSSYGSGVATVSQNFSVSQGASVMAVALYDNNNTGPGGPAGPNLVWSNFTFGTVQPLTLAVQANTTAYTWTWADLYYVMDPLPGPGVVIGTDTASTHNAMFMQVYTLSGVDTTAVPAGYNTGNGGASVLSVDTDPSTVALSWAPVISVNYNGGGGNDLTFTATSGTVLANNFRPNGLQCTMGYISNLGAGDTTITATGSGVATHMSEGAMVFSPLSSLAAPTGLTASGQTNRIFLSWTDGSGGLASNYVVWRSLISGHAYTAIATNVGNGSTTYIDTAITDWTPYYYVVQAYGAGGISLLSAEATAYAVGLPAAVTSLSAFGDIYKVDLSWNNGLGADLYRVQRSTTSGSGFSTIGSSSTGAFTDTTAVPGTLYYYIVTASNVFGFGPNSSQASAVPVITFFTNWFGIFNSDADASGWTVLNGSPSIYFYADPPPSGPSSGCLLIDTNYGPGTTADLQGAANNFTPNLNISTYKAIELDIKNEGVFDDYSQIQAIQLNLQVPVGGNPLYERGTFGDIVLYSTGTGGSWTHYSAPLSNWSAYDLTGVSSFGINIFDANCVAAAKNLVVGFANIAFTGAPGWASAISDVNSRVVPAGSTGVTLSGRVSGIVAGTNVYLWVNTPVSVSINGHTQSTVINDATGDFSIVFNTTGFGNATYPVTYACGSDMVALLGATNSVTSLTIGGPPPSKPTIQPPMVDGTGTNLLVKVATQSGYLYELLSTASLNPPVVWTTNSITVGTGGVITNLVPIVKSQPALYVKYLVQ